MSGKNKGAHVSDQIYADVFKHAPVGAYTLNKDGVITSFNPKMAELSGGKAEDAIGLNALKLDTYKKVGLDKYFKRGLEGKKFETEVTYESYLANKTTVRFYRGIPMKSRGEAKLLLIVEDITKRKETENQLLESQHQAEIQKKRLQALINSLSDGVIATDKQGKITLYNSSALNLFDINTDIVGQNVSSVCKIIDSNNQAVNLSERLKNTTSQSISSDLRLHYPDQSSINIYLAVSAIDLGFGFGGRQGYVIMMRDITTEKSLEQERAEFISVVSHELRIPIAVTEGSISNAQFIAKEKSLDNVIGQDLEKAHQQIMFLSSILNDLSTLSRAERGKLTIEPEPINAYELVHELASNRTGDAKAKQLKIHVKADPKLHVLRSSRMYVREILENFVTNAIKYTGKGSVTISAKSTKSGVMFQVSDTGFGISKGDQARLFSRFFRSEDKHIRDESGTGLGLYVCSKLAKLLGAKVEFSSKLRHGSTFSIDVPNIKKK